MLQTAFTVLKSDFAAPHDAFSARNASIQAAYQTWEKTLAALKRGARAASDDGEPYLYTTLFGQAARNGGRNGKHAQDNPPPPAPPVSGAA
ncbi:MAG TPA: hypothetical protein VF515_15800 [Candidatus Binatia bacterium]